MLGHFIHNQFMTQEKLCTIKIDNQEMPILLKLSIFELIYSKVG